jgi:hypothetical protein
MILLRSNLFRRILLISLLLSLSPHLWATAKNGYYHKETAANFTHYDVMARFGTPTIDGILSVGEWDVNLAGKRYKYDRDDNRIHYLFQYDNDNFYVLVDVDDDKLWDDEALTSGQHGLENWVTWQDDGVEIYLDPNNSRDAVLTSSDRLIAFSIQSRHYRFDVGNNSGSTSYFGDIGLIKKQLVSEVQSIIIVMLMKVIPLKSRFLGRSWVQHRCLCLLFLPMFWCWKMMMGVH